MAATRILIVDDQKFAARLLRNILAPLGYEVDEAADGLAACRLAVERQPDLILMDLVMPGMDGAEACRRIKGDSRTSAIPVIVVTAGKDLEHHDAAFAAGADDYLAKPFTPHDVLTRIHANLIKRETFGLLKQKLEESEVLREITQAITSTLDTDEILRIIVTRIAGHIQVERCSIIRTVEQEGYACVLASSDDPAVNGLRIHLDKYPEIREVVRTGQSVVLQDARNHPLLEGVRDEIARLDYNTILVLPIIYRCEVIGTLMLRTAGVRASFTERELAFCQLVANVSAGALKNALLFEKVREESEALREVRARLERELQEKAVYESIFEHASEGLLALNVRSEVVYINRAAIDILGYTREEMQHLTLQDFWAEESYQEAVANHMGFFLGSDYKKKYDLVFKTRSGEKRCVAVSVSDHRLRGSCAILAFTDVTEERTARARLEEANAHFKGLDLLKSDFINTATHELRTPVTLLHCYCSLLQETGAENLSPEQRRYLAAVLSSSERLVDLTDDLLDLARLDAGKGLQLEEKHLLEPVREAYAALSPLAEHHGLMVSLEPGAEDVRACFDSEQIRSVVANLIGNAVKFTPRGGRIGICVARSGAEAQVTVTDTGIGIPAEHFDAIFDEFSQVKSPGSPKRGSGLGLAICKRVIEAHGGRIWVDSIPGEGSSFTFALPLSSR